MTATQYTLADIAEALGGTLVGDGSRKIRRPVHPDDAGPDDLAVAMAKGFLPKLADSRATMAMIAANAADQVPAHIKDYILITRAQNAMSVLTGAYDKPRYVAAGIHPTAIIDPSAKIGADVTVGPYTIIGPDSVIGEKAIIYGQVTVGANVQIGAGTMIMAGVRLGDDTQIGARSIIQINAVIGSDGFSFVTSDRGSVEQVKSGEHKIDATQANTHLLRIASLGPVIIGDDVEIGAGTTIDRATLRATRIGSGTKIDNLVQIGHNVEIGENCMICGQAGIAGSVKVGNRVVLAGRTGLADNIQIGDDAVVAAAAGVGGNVPPRTVVMGTPAIPREKYHQQYLALGRLPRLLDKIEALQNRINKLEADAENR